MKRRKTKRTSKLVDRTVEESLALTEAKLIAEGSRFRGDLTDLTVELVARWAGFRRSLPEGIVAALALGPLDELLLQQSD